MTNKTVFAIRRGFTLVETLVGMAIISLIVPVLVMTMYTALGTQHGVVEEGLAISELRRGLSWFSTDAQMAKTTDLTEGVPGETLVLTWTDDYAGAAIDHTVSYTLDGSQLLRTYDGQSHVVADRVLSVSFSRTGSSITATAQVDAGLGDVRALSVTSVMRPTA